MKGENIHILEKDPVAGRRVRRLQVRGRRLCHARRPRDGQPLRGHVGSVPLDSRRSKTEGYSVLDEYYWLNKADPNYSLCRATENRGRGRAHRRQVRPSRDKGAMEIMQACSSRLMRSFRTSASPISSTTRCLNSNFWLYWRTMFAFENWHSALEMKLYHQALHPSHRRSAGLQGAALHPLQSV